MGFASGTRPGAKPKGSTVDTQQMNIRINPDLYDQIKAISAAEERTVTQTIRYVLRQYVATHQAR